MKPPLFRWRRTSCGMALRHPAVATLARCIPGRCL